MSPRIHATRLALLSGLSAVLVLGTHPALAESRVPFGGGKTMQSATVFFIYWVPPGFTLDSSVADGTGNFRAVLEGFTNDLPTSSYLNVVTQYPGACGNGQCVLANVPGITNVGGSFLETRPYPGGRGSKSNPLSDADIRDEIVAAMSANGWAPGFDKAFVVITPAGVENCVSGFLSRMCSFDTFCGYHTYFWQGSVPVIYAYLIDANFDSGGDCTGGVAAAVNSQIASDREVVVYSHELFEMITDPVQDAWNAGGDDGEMADRCAGTSGSLMLNGKPYIAQKMWDNSAGACTTSFGPSVRFAIDTFDDDLRGDSTATASLRIPDGTPFQTVTLKDGSQPSWTQNAGKLVVAPFSGASSSKLGQVALTLSSQHGAFERFDQWTLKSFKATVLAPNGNLLCEQDLSGTPLAVLNASSATVVFDTPACLPPSASAEPVLCSIFDDGYSNLVGPSDAIFFDDQGRACVPTGPVCRKWFGRCVTASSGVPVTFTAFNDGLTNETTQSDAVFVNGSQQACIPGSGASGTCRRWFGDGLSGDARFVTCRVFDDGYSNLTNLSGATFVNSSHRACIPSGTAQGSCRRWWGLCEASVAPLPPPGPASSRLVAVGVLPDHRLELWIGTDAGQLFATRQDPADPDSSWKSWASFLDEVGPLPPLLRMVSVAPLPDGRLELWATLTSGQLFTTRMMDTSDGAAWEPWADFVAQVGTLSEPVVQSAAAPLLDGRLELWATTALGHLFTTWKTATDPNAAWASWSDFLAEVPGPFQGVVQVAAAPLSDGRLEVWATTVDGRLFTTWKTSTDPNAPWEPWVDFLAEVLGPLRGGVVQVAVAPLSDGRLEVWATTVDGKLLTTWKTTADSNAQWGPWVDFLAEVGALPGGVRQVAVAPLSDGRLRLWAVTGQDGLSSTWKMTTDSNAQWAPWAEFLTAVR